MWMMVELIRTMLVMMIKKLLMMVMTLCFLLLNGLPGEPSLKNEEGEAPAVCHPQLQKGVILQC